jgi:hypothetical protein
MPRAFTSHFDSSHRSSASLSARHASHHGVSPRLAQGSNSPSSSGRVIEARAQLVGDVAALGDCVRAASTWLQSVSPQPLVPVVQVVGGDLGEVFDMHPSFEALLRLGVRYSSKADEVWASFCLDMSCQGLSCVYEDDWLGLHCWNNAGAVAAWQSGLCLGLHVSHGSAQPSSTQSWQQQTG